MENGGYMPRMERGIEEITNNLINNVQNSIKNIRNEKRTLLNESA